MPVVLDWLVAPSGAASRGSVRLRTAPVPGALTLKNALENGHFSPFGAGPLLQPHAAPADHALVLCRIQITVTSFGNGSLEENLDWG